MPYIFYFGRLRDWIARELDLTSEQAAFILLDLEEIKGQDAVLGMFGYIRYAEINAIPYGKRRATVSHDLNGRKEKLCVPRTTDYLQFVNL